MTTKSKIVLSLFFLYLNGCSTDSELVWVNNHVHCTTHSSCTNHIKTRVLEKWEAPKSVSATVQKVSFKIWLSEHGTVEDIKKISSSGSEIIDNIALAAVNHSSPFLELSRLDFDVIENSIYRIMIIVFDPEKHDLTVELT